MRRGQGREEERAVEVLCWWRKEERGVREEEVEVEKFALSD